MSLPGGMWCQVLGPMDTLWVLSSGAMTKRIAFLLSVAHALLSAFSEAGLLRMLPAFRFRHPGAAAVLPSRQRRNKPRCRQLAPPYLSASLGRPRQHLLCCHPHQRFLCRRHRRHQEAHRLAVWSAKRWQPLRCLPIAGYPAPCPCRPAARLGTSSWRRCHWRSA